MGKEIRILLVDDHQVVRDGISSMLADSPDMEVVGQSAGGEEVLTLIAQHSPNIILMDIKMPRMDGIQLTSLVQQKNPDCKIVMLTLYDEYLTQAMEAGAKGYLLKDTSREYLIQAIRQVYQGEVVISDNISIKPQIEYERREVELKESLLQQPDSPDSMLEEVHMIISSPADANQVIRFTTRVEEILKPRIIQIVGSWREGTAVTATLSGTVPLFEILSKLRTIAGVDTLEEAKLKMGSNTDLIKKALSIPRRKNRAAKTIFVDLDHERSESVLRMAYR